MPMISPKVLRMTLAMAAATLLPTDVGAQSCTFGVTNMAFGIADTVSGAAINSTATVSVNCTSLLPTRVVICPNIGEGNGGSTTSARRMLAGANILNYQLFSDASRTAVWGSYAWPYPSRAPPIVLDIGLLGSASTSVTMYGAIAPGQSTAATGSYLSAFSAGHVEFRYRATSSTSCSSGTGTIARPSFNITATVAANCLVATQNIDFGSVGVLSSNVNSTGQVTVTCTPSTAYTVGLGNGQTGTGPTTRRMTLGTQAVTYGLYRDAAHSQPWGSAAGTTVPGTGTGLAQNLTVYGRVPPQTTPSPGTYSDTVVVTVTY